MFFHRKQPQKNFKRENLRGFRDKLHRPDYSQNQRVPPHLKSEAKMEEA
jgi:hypothetical protein